jgi:signal transduction histidine kinase/ActR/RegA family two-component response regulator
MHTLLKRQLKRLGVSAQEPPSAAQWRAVLERVSRSYGEADQDRYTLERSLSISSREMQDLYENLRRTAAGELARKHEELVSSLAVLHATHEAVPDGILVIGPDRRILNFNRRFATIWKIPDDLLALRDDERLLSFVLPQLADPDEFLTRVRYLYDHPTEASRDEIHLVDGRVLDRHSSPALSDQGQCRGRVWSFRDITDQRRAQQALRLLNSELEKRVEDRTRALGQANRELDENLHKLRETQNQLLRAGKMAAVGTLAAGVAHEINNPLGYVLNNLAFAREQVDALAASAGASAERIAQIREALADVVDGAERVRAIVRDLRVMSRPEPEQRLPVDVNAALETAVGFAGAELRQRARVSWDLGPVPAVSANEARLGQVFLNLVVNAAQALPEGQLERNEIQISSRVESQQVIVAVRDNGVGIPGGHLPRLFDPFFTTKAVGKGTGLGLSICQAIISGLGGRIEVESQVGEGSTFRVILPADDGARDFEALPSASVRPAGAGPRGRVLIVDDEEQVGKSLRRLLGSEHDVIHVNDGQQALAVLEGAAWFDVLLCDLMMPGMSGMDFFAELARRRPDTALRVVFMTGAVTSASEAFLARIGNRWLEKPCDPKVLRGMVREMVGQAPARLPTAELAAIDLKGV